MTTWKITAYRTARRLLRKLPGACDLRLHSIIGVQPEHLRLPARLLRQLSVRWLQLSDEPAMQALRPALGAPYQQRLREGHRCLGAFFSGPAEPRLIAFIWIVPGPARMPASFGCAWDLSATMLWLYDLHSSSDVIGALPHFYQYLRQHPPGPNFTHWMGQTDLENVRSCRSHLSLGFEVRATLWSFRCSAWRHLSHAVRPRRWRGHRQGGGIPLPLFVACDQTPPVAAPEGNAPLGLQCICGATVAFRDGTMQCGDCGHSLGQSREGYYQAGPPTDYWGEVRQPEMEALLTCAQTEGWRAAVAARLRPDLFRYIADSERAAFHELLPLRRGARVLDIGAGWGSIAAPLARYYQVVALEGVSERARFIALRKRQDRLDQLAVLCGQFQRTTLASHQFDGIIANGVLEWSPLADLDDSPRSAQLRFLVRLRELLRSGGCIYLAIENRFGREMFRGVRDHSGLPYTSLMPRWLAHRVCRAGSAYRAQNNTGYRTYTYSWSAYRRLFAEAGLRIESSWVSLPCYNNPYRLVPLHRQAIRFSTHRHPHSGLRARARAAANHPLVWRWFASDFTFLLRPIADTALPHPAMVHENDRVYA